MVDFIFFSLSDKFLLILVTILSIIEFNILLKNMAKNYTSDTTNFLRDFLTKNPEVKTEQMKARSAWWDKNQDFEEQEKIKGQKIPKKPYEYY